MSEPPPTFVLGTTNAGKAAEIAAILAGRVSVLPRPGDVPPVEETGETLLDNARLKASAVARTTGSPAIAEDTGLEVDALGGRPGVHTASFAGDDATDTQNVAHLLRELAGKAGPAARRARFRTVAVARWPGGEEVVAEGVVTGWIAEAPRGSGGFGYDPVFVPDEGDGRTFAELAAEDTALKNGISHRGRAFRALADLLGAGGGRVDGRRARE